MTAMYAPQIVIKSVTLTRPGERPRTVQLMQYQDDNSFHVTVSPEHDHTNWETLGDRMTELEARCMYANNVLAHAGAF